MNNKAFLSFPIRTYPYRVFYADTDAGGVVYYAQYLRMFEQVRALYVEEYGAYSAGHGTKKLCFCLPTRGNRLSFACPFG